MAISHTNCTHPRTSAGRRACRSGGTAYQPMTLAQSATLIADLRSSGRMETAPRRSEKPARIQPRRGGARVATRGSACVQAALHIDAHGGRCACGWEAAA